MPSGAEKLASLRNLMKNIAVKDNKKGIEAYIVGSGDAHSSEYVQERDKRRQFITGFKGSAGTAVITPDKALLWTDGRYYDQALSEFDPPTAWTLMKDGLADTPSIENWLSENLSVNATVGLDPNYMDESTVSRIKNSLSTVPQDILCIENNLIDVVWGKDQPAPVLNKIVPLRLVHTGKTAGDKVKDCFVEMENNKVSALVISALDDVAWLLNWRGTDILYNPVFFCFVVLFSKKVHIFVQEERLTPEAKKQLIDEKVDFQIHPYENVKKFLNKICIEEKKCTRVWVSSSSNYALHSACGSINVYNTMIPPKIMKSVKNETEVAGMKVAHIKDAVGIIKYFAWLEDKILNHKNDDSVVTELTGSQQLEKFRGEQENYKGPSFNTISAVGRHAANPHYDPTPKTDVPINSQEFYLCDTGSQFPEGTTDVTRTLHFGQPTEYEKECFTRVFKGQCNLALAKFPLSIKGNYLDSYARKYLWDVGLDYLHGTGHGVGSHLCVHEFPSMISWRPYPDDTGLRLNMFTSNEPGYYEEGKFGIRLENVEVVVKAKTTYNMVNREFGTFETVTLIPIQTKCLNISMLTDEEINYLNNYHEKCLKVLKPLLQGPENSQALAWLEKETKPIKKLEFQ